MHGEISPRPGEEIDPAPITLAIRLNGPGPPARGWALRVVLETGLGECGVPQGLIYARPVPDVKAPAARLHDPGHHFAPRSVAILREGDPTSGAVRMRARWIVSCPWATKCRSAVGV